jgi:hypothetical protein
MPISSKTLGRLDAAIDNHLKRRDSEYHNTDPVEFLESPSARRHNNPVAEPAQMPQEDSAPSHIHAGKKDLFK